MSDPLLVADILRRRLEQQSLSAARMFAAVDVRGSGRVTVRDLQEYLERQGYPCSLLEEAALGAIVASYAGSAEAGLDFRAFADFATGRGLGEMLVRGGVRGAVLSGASEGVPRDSVEAAPEIARRALRRLREDLRSPAGLYAYLSGGVGFLYCHGIRDALERRCGVCFSEEEWASVERAVKRDPLVLHVSQYELGRFLGEEGGSPRQRASGSTEADVAGVPPKRVAGADEPREAGGANEASQASDSDAESYRPPVLTVSEYYIDPAETAGGIASGAAHGIACDAARESARDSARSTALPISRGAAVSGPAPLLAVLISQKLQAMGRPREIFSRFDLQRKNYLTCSDLRRELSRILGLDLSLSQVQDVISYLRREHSAPDDGPLVRYKTFLLLYNAQTGKAVGRDGRPSSPAAQFARRPVVLSAGRAGSVVPVGRAAPPDTRPDIPASAPASRDFPGYSEDPDAPCASAGARAPRSPAGAVYTSAQIDSAPAAMSERPPTRGGPASFVTEPEAAQKARDARETRAFREQVRRVLRNRRESVGDLLYDAFGQTQKVTPYEALCFFRGRVGVSISPLVVFRALDAVGKRYIPRDTIVAFVEG